MIEDYVQYLWKFQVFIPKILKGTKGETIEIIHQGDHNHHAGPDFKNASMKIDGIQWHGHVEIHVKSKHWNQHLHQEDPAYDNVILHVVWSHDKEVETSAGRELITLEIQSLIPKTHWKEFRSKLPVHREIPCNQSWKQIDDFIWSNHLHRMFVSRLEQKATALIDRKNNDGLSWQEATWIQLCRAFGFGTNGDAMEQLARKVPIQLIQRFRTDHPKLAALLLGQAGFLVGQERKHSLNKTFESLRSAFILSPMSLNEWNHGRIHPSNMPSRRLIQLSQFLNQTNLDTLFFSNKMTISEIHQSFRWDLPINMDGIKGGTNKIIRMGAGSRENVIFNAVLVSQFAYHLEHKRFDQTELIAETCYQLAPENNQIMNKWARLGIIPTSIAESQALLMLFKEYCSKKKCLNCAIGVKLISQK